jgi:hypothetical protein
MTNAEQMMALFEGSDLAHGRSEMTQEVSKKGKHETKSWIEKRAVTLKDWEEHLAGKRGIGIPPLNSKNQVRWGAIDVDVYNGLDLDALNTNIQMAGLPLVLCRSKSGGPHIFLFTEVWVPASEMIEKLDALAAFLGFATSEIFPKQAMIGQDSKNPDFGSWINMPYFGGTQFFRYALDNANKAIQTVPEFVAYVRSKTLSLAQFSELRSPVSQDLLPDGPPCLNQLMAKGPTEFRNVILSNVAVYLKKRYDEAWQPELDKYNAMLPEPLGSSEVEAIKKSYDRKDYRFQCSKQPLCSFCDSSACKKAKFGIGGKDMMPSSRSLTMIDTNPPIWYLDVALADGKERRISLSTEQLQNPRLFQRRCMEALQKMPPSMKMEEWEQVIAQLMQHCTVIEIPPEMSPEGQFTEMVWEFLNNRATTDSYEDMLRGLPFKNEKGYHFRLKDLFSHVKNQRFDDLKKHEMTATLKSRLLGEKGYKVIKGTGVNFITVPLQPNSHQPEPLEPAKFDSAF